MAHNLNQVNGVTAMAYNAQDGGTPWHKLGQAVEGAMTAQDVLTKAHLDYTVSKEPIFSCYRDSIVQIPEHFCTMRTDTLDALGVVGKRYEVIQNKDCFDFFDSIVGDGKAIYQSAGALGKGERVWIAAKLPSDIIVKGNDVINQYLLLSLSHDGSSPVKAAFTPVRVVCQNTLTSALSAVTSCVNIRHTKNAKDKLAEAHKLLGIVAKQTEAATSEWNLLANTDMQKEANFQTYLDSVFGKIEDSETAKRKNVRDNVSRLFVAGKGNDGKSLWSAYNAVTEYVDHDRAVQADTNITEASIFGSGVMIKEKAYAAAMALAQQIAVA